MKGCSLNSSLSVVFLLFFGFYSFAQVTGPGGVEGSSIWYNEEDDTGLIANRHSFDLLAFEDEVSTHRSALEKATTYFFVLKPNFKTASGASFMKLGQVEIFDDRIEYGTHSKAIQFTDDQPKIFTIVSPPPRRYGRRVPTEMHIKDSTLFEVAEVVLFEDRLSRFDIHKVNTYLALKYSITITQNTDALWRNYHKADSTLYWSEVIDRLYNKTVIGLGNSEDEAFTQTQTATSSGAFMQLSLDTPVALGQMPQVIVDEDAFLVLSERNPFETMGNNPCAFTTSATNPMINWKLKLHDWSSPAQHLYIRTDLPTGKLADSLFLTDGTNFWHLPQTVIGNRVEYKVYFDMLNNHLHYFFVEQKDNNPCINKVLRDDSQDLVVDNTSSPGSEWTLETQSLKTGVIISETTAASTLSRSMEEGQHIVTLLDADGNILSQDVVRILAQEELEGIALQPDIRLYPVPAIAGQEVTLSVSDLPSTSRIRLVAIDASGRVLDDRQVDHQEYIESAYRFDVPGMYQVILYQDQFVYSLRVVVVQ